MVFMDFVVFGIYQVFILDTKKPLPLTHTTRVDIADTVLDTWQIRGRYG
jgi:hypothetical protein